MRTHRALALVLVATMAVVASCRSSTGPWPATVAKGMPPAEARSILYLTRSLPKVLVVDSVEARRSPENRMIVEVTLLNLQPKALRLQIQTTFLAGDGSETGKTNFQNFMIPANKTKTYRVSSMNDRPDLYEVRVRRL